jgi:hypothetical protein
LKKVEPKIKLVAPSKPMADNEIPDERQLAYKTQYTKKAKRNIT